MNINGFSTVRTTDNARAASAASQIGRTQAALSRAQQELSTGKRLIRPSDDPGDAVVAQQLQKTLEARQTYATNLRHGQRLLGDVDEALGGAGDLLREAYTLAQANLGDAVSRDEQKGAALALRGIESRLLDLANTRSGGVSLFGGDADVDPYRADTAGVRFVGNPTALTNRVSGRAETDILLAGGDVFGGLSERVGKGDLSPVLTNATRLSDLGGARGSGVTGGVIRLNNAGATADVDLRDADTVGDVLDRINASGIGVTAAISASGEGITLAGASLTVAEAGGTTATDLGILQPVAAAAVGGVDVRPRISDFTPLSSLNGGAGIDTTGGLTVSNGGQSNTFDLSGVATVGELLDRLNAGPVPLRAGVSDDGDSLVLHNPVQGGELRVREGAGTTAADLGWLTFTAADGLNQLNGGRGVTLNKSGPDLTLIDAADVSFDVDLDAAGTVQDAADAINAAATAAGASVAASFDPNAPGLVLSNVTRVTSVNDSTAAVDLGLDGTIPPGGTLIGRNVNPVTSEGVFGHLRSLIAALDAGDDARVTASAESLSTDEASILSRRGEAGSRLQEFDARLDRLDDQDVATRATLSELEDVDYTRAVTRFQSLQTSLQASLQTTGQLFDLTLFNFLR